MTRDRLLWIALALLGVGAVFLIGSELIGGAGTVDDRIGRGLYLGVLGLVIAAGVLNRRRLGETVRALGMWALIVLVLVAGYQYRYELQDVASRVTAGLIPGSPLSITNADGSVAVVLNKLANGHFEVDAQVNGAPVRMMIDTGATTTVMSAEDAARAGIETSTLNFQVPVSTANGQALAARAVIQEIRVGAIDRRSMPVLVAAEGMLQQSLLGMNFIGTLSGFDIRGDRMTLRN
ncbi:MAG: TIGR02281 family clan AA aspartic protease [Rhizobiaceae bacterium]|nr:TIGR02281 family clan AA aspartic protease [Rhizobiaceae bacterium]